MLNISEIVQTVKGIVETRIGLVKEEIQDEFLGILSRIILLTVIGSLLLLVFLFLSLSLAFFLSQVTKSPYMGFLIVALIYFLIVLVMFLSKDSLQIQEKTEGLLKRFIFKRKINEDQNNDE
ncbi:phage holin family protein [Algoriphagus boritolerans]|uniref:Putative Holin-X, holin superfamily III n=1 Tax=Algoriphagus boritolerans DSM 17298 = JCM 18970 TaxID=1120964 RepID=A0A1H5YWG4_9BACT|nr:phage holin family protein [Algoriphagus boritolerans]SEG28364.1 Putative Holin-X, holin superfamily III [Algoriphagus boritolerans DSM 17298 = JCM 18970]